MNKMRSCRIVQIVTGLLLVNLGFWISRSPDLWFSRFLFWWNIFWGNMLVRYRGINNKGVLDRPWTIWKVLMAISSTLKCQFTENHENEKIWLFGETEHRRPGVYFDAQYVSAHFCLVKTPSIAIWGNKSVVGQVFRFFQFSQFAIRQCPTSTERSNGFPGLPFLPQIVDQILASIDVESCLWLHAQTMRTVDIRAFIATARVNIVFCNFLVLADVRLGTC